MGWHKRREFGGWRIERLARSECSVQVQLNLLSWLSVDRHRCGTDAWLNIHTTPSAAVH